MPKKYNNTYYNQTNTCYRCKINKLYPKSAFREYKNGKWTGKWVCKSCYEYRPIIKEPRHRTMHYNATNTCRCGNNLIAGKARREYINGIWTGEWICINCYNKKNYLVADFRNGNLDPNSTTGKGYIFEQITCKARGVKNLNIENDNFDTPIDHSRDHEYGIIQTKGAIISYGIWYYNLEGEIFKEFDNLIVYCMDINTKKVERVYIVPWEEVVTRSSITIRKNPKRPTDIWYEQYRVDERHYNEVYRNMKLADCPVLRSKNGAKYVYELF